MRLARNDGIGSEDAGAIYMWTAVLVDRGRAPALCHHAVPAVAQSRRHRHAQQGWVGGVRRDAGRFPGPAGMAATGARSRFCAGLDASAPSVVLGTAITRVGCLLFGCDYGKVSHVAWAIRFPRDAPAWKDHVYNMHALAPDSAWSLPVHPTQIYETLGGLAIFGLVMYLRRVRKFSGEVFLGWVMGYGIVRPIIEIYRGDDRPRQRRNSVDLAVHRTGLGRGGCWPACLPGQALPS